MRSCRLSVDMVIWEWINQRELIKMKGSRVMGWSMDCYINPIYMYSNEEVAVEYESVTGLSWLKHFVLWSIH